MLDRQTFWGKDIITLYPHLASGSCHCTNSIIEHCLSGVIVLHHEKGFKLFVGNIKWLWRSVVSSTLDLRIAAEWPEQIIWIIIKWATASRRTTLQSASAYQGLVQHQGSATLVTWFASSAKEFRIRCSKEGCNICVSFARTKRTKITDL